MKSVELLLPAGDFEKMKFAFAFGADAVYLGIPRFSLRARENKFRTMEAVIDAVSYGRNLGKKVYVTANIIPHNRKIKPFLDFIDEFLRRCQPDAWIMSDPGMIMFIKDRHPEQIIHLSVQANTVNYATAKFWERMGVKRVILSRELSIPEIKAIKEYCPKLEIEVFVHGAICIAYSGRCLISNYLASRDPNQGTCSNSCRWQYKLYQKAPLQPTPPNSTALSETAITQSGDSYHYLSGDFYLEEAEKRPGQFMQIDEDENGTYLMNARDLCAIEYLAELREAGVDSFKIEGRTKSVYYVSLITRAYRRALDDVQAGKPFDLEKIFRDIFSTANKGFTAGFLKGNPGHSAQRFDVNMPESQCYRFSGIVRGYDEDRHLIFVDPKNKITHGMALELITPENTFPFTAEHIYDERFKKVESISGGVGSYWISCPIKPGEFALLREPIAEFSLG